MAPAGEFLITLGRQAGDHLWQSTAVAAVAALLALALKSNHARARYWLWMAASLKFLVPFALLAAVGARLGGWLIPAAPAPRVPMAVEQIAQPFTAVQFDAPLGSVAPQPSASFPFPALLMGLWICGFAVVIFTWWMKWRRVAAAVRASTPLTEGREVEALRRVHQACCKIGAGPVRGASCQLAESAVEPTLKRPRRLSAQQAWTPAPQSAKWSIPRVVCSSANLEPGIFGIFRQVLWLPAGIADRLSDAELEAIVAHELCHARRRDNLAAAIHMIIEAVFWFHPLVWWLGGRLTEERERACDEEVLRIGANPQAYAEGILRVCEFYVASPAPCAAGVTGGELKRRIEAIMKNRGSLRLSFGKKLLMAAAGALVASAPFIAGLAKAQSNTSPRFEVASVKLSKSQEREMGYTGMPPILRSKQAAVNFPHVLLKGVVAQAYWLRPGEVTGPAWLDSTFYDIMAKPPQGATAEDVPKMLQTLLAERFRMRVHWETRQESGYALVVSKTGATLKTSDADPDGPTGGYTIRGADVHLKYNRTTLKEFAKALTFDMGRPVVDETGIQGLYDIAFDCSAESLPFFSGMNQSTDPGSAPSIFNAMKALGLSLVPQRVVPVARLVVDSAEKVPTEN
jgi:bla regulator protein BlaR1